MSKIAVIVAMPQEFAAVTLAFRLNKSVEADDLGFTHFYSSGVQFMLVESGMGFDNAANATEKIIHNYSPELLISTGFCGAVSPELRVGDIVVAKNIVIAEGKTFEVVPVKFSSIGQNFVACHSTEGARIFGGTFISSSTIRSKKVLYEMLPTTYSNSVVEMESGAIAIVAAENNIPFLALRVVSDAADEELKFSMDELCDADMRNILIHKVFFTVLRKPYILPQLIRLGYNSRIAANRLSVTLTTLFSNLQNIPRS